LFAGLVGCVHDVCSVVSGCIFYRIVVLAPQGQFFVKKKTRGTSLRVPRQRRLSQNWPMGSKLPQMQNLWGGFVVFFLRGPKSQLWES